MKSIRVLFPLVLLCAACRPQAAPPPASTPASTRPVSTDAPDTSGSPPTDAGTSASPPPVGVAAMAEAGDLLPGMPACAAGDGRLPIPVYSPRVDAQGVLSAAPPGADGDIVLLTLQGNSDAKCLDSESNTFSIPHADGSPGGLKVSVRGNTQEIDGVCHFNGLYRRKDGQGERQGWTRQSLESVDTSQIVSSNRYCTQQNAAPAAAPTPPPPPATPTVPPAAPNGKNGA
ncbi:MAG: hypothetical protein QM601_14245 [Pseudoxanthomonas sp.]